MAKGEIKDATLTRPTLALPRSGISVVDGVLVKAGADGTPSSRFPLREIQLVDVRYRTDWGMLAISMVFLALSLVSLRFIGSALFAWVVTVLLAGCALFCFLIRDRQCILVTTGMGTAELEVSETSADGEAFLLSLRHEIDSCREFTLEGRRSQLPDRDADRGLV